MENLKNQLTEITDEALHFHDNRSFFLEECLREIEKQGFQFESTKEIVTLSKKAFNIS